MIRSMFKPWWAYRREGFHPNQLHNDLSLSWLQSNQQAFTEVNGRLTQPT
jgi:hypothetical protein